MWPIVNFSPSQASFQKLTLIYLNYFYWFLRTQKSLPVIYVEKFNFFLMVFTFFDVFFVDITFFEEGWQNIVDTKTCHVLGPKICQYAHFKIIIARYIWFF